MSDLITPAWVDDLLRLAQSDLANAEAAHAAALERQRRDAGRTNRDCQVPVSFPTIAEFRAWLRAQPHGRDAVVGFARQAPFCPLARCLTDRGAPWALVRPRRATWSANGPRTDSDRGELPAWALTLARRIDARHQLGQPVCAGTVLDLLDEVAA